MYIGCYIGQKLDGMFVSRSVEIGKNEKYYENTHYI